MIKILLLGLIVLLPLTCAEANKQNTESDSTESILSKLPVEKSTNPVICISTDKGDMYLEMFPDVAPEHVKSMLALIKKGFYNGLIFHRVVPGFVIQGGCPNGTGTGDAGYKLKAEFNSRKHLKGTLAMARAAHPDSAGSQFYICLDEIPHLDGQYTVFGQLRLGEDVPEKVTQGDKMKISIIRDLLN